MSGRKKQVIEFPVNESHLDFKEVITDCCPIEYIVSKISSDGTQTYLRTVKKEELTYDNKPTSR